MAVPDAAREESKRARWRPVLITGALTGVLALVAALAVIWPGFDAQQTPRENPTVWALQTGEGKRYARVNTQLGELDTIKNVENPSGIAQHGETVLVFADGNQRVAEVNPALPSDLGGESEAFVATPPDTAQMQQTQGQIAYLTGSGEVFVSSVTDTGSTLIDPYAGVEAEEGEEPPTFVTTAFALGVNETIAAYSAEEGRIIIANSTTGEILTDENVDVDAGESPQLALVGDRPVLLNVTSGELWVSGLEATVSTGVDAGARLQRSSAPSDSALIADTTGLVRVGIETAGVSRVTDDLVSGVPAAPTPVADGIAAVWLGESAGTLWTSGEGTRTLDYAGEELGDELDPEFFSNGTTSILNETRSGWVWTLPEGELVASSQSWNMHDRVPEQLDEVEAERVIDPKPPVAVNDSFGVRAGRDVTLSVLLNDHDPNEDVLSIAPGSVSGLAEDFGTLAVANNEQQIVVSVADEATGSATFTYQVTDGTASDGLLSNTATVTLTVMPEEVNTAPEWCGVDGCLSEWPSPQLTPGGTSQTEVLGGWVDPEGDPIYVSHTANPTDVGAVLTTPEGTVTYQHPDPNEAESRTVPLEVTVTDVHGASSTKTLTTQVVPAPQLTLEPFSVSGVTDSPVMVDLQPHVSGATGAARLTSVTPLDEAAGSVTENSAALHFSFLARSAGSYPIQVTVADDAAEVTKVVRVTLAEADEAEISTVPLTAFVRPNEDATVDVLPAVSNPAGEVLLVSDLETDTASDASLSASVIGQQHIRLAGATEDGDPGTLGVITYRVSDGSNDEGRSATGEITVVLLDAADSTPPIAVDDRVTVRAGAQVDIPVLDNDTAPAGSQISIDPSLVINESEAGLAFGTNTQIRYLAPDTPGTYTVKYTIYRLGFPSMTDSARIHITVVGEGSNQAPVPTVLEGRVRSGATVSIPFAGYGIDPDGDATELDRIASQPELGSATVSADGDSIIYTSDSGEHGQDRFTYVVRDAQGQTGVAEVRVGVLDGESDPSPVTYSDYAQLQVGAENEVSLFPLDNDIDPSGTALELMDVRPNAVGGTEEYAALADRLASFNSDTGEVRILAGEELGTSSYVYTARNGYGDSAMGLIVTKVVREPVPDYPKVRDTKLTAETLSQLQSGVDVLSDKVSWSTGDTNGLRLSLWQEDSAFRTSGWNISGAAGQTSQIVPFEVSGTSFTGEEVTSYGFLRVPGEENIRLSLRSSFTHLEVHENEEVTLDLSDAVITPDGEVLEVDRSDVRTSGVRAEATCTIESGSQLRYRAGSGAPWNDACTVAVKLESQSEYTYLTVRVRVIADDPQPELRQGALTVSPGDEVTYDLHQMATWEGNESLAGLSFDVSYQGEQFAVQQQGTTLTVSAADTAQPSRTEPATVSLPSHPDAEVATLRLTVGPAPSALPRGASVTQTCSQAGGQTDCLIPVVGQPGEVNPLPGTPLELVSVQSPANCSGVTFSVANSETVRANWRSDTPGAGDCTASFTVKDAQERTSGGDRAGQIVLDLQGLPATPTRLDWTAYSSDSVRLDPVSESSSYPAVSGYRVTGAGKQVNCPASGGCVISGLANGSQHEFRVQAINDVGESRGNATVTAWAYRAPRAPEMRGQGFEPVENGLDGRRANIMVNVTDRSTSRLMISGPDANRITVQVPQSGRVSELLTLGSNAPQTITVTPVTSHELPPAHVSAGSSEGDALVIPGVHGVGAPTNVTLELSTDVDGRTIHATASAERNGAERIEYAFVLDGATCSGQYGQTAQKDFGNVERGRDIEVKVCVRHAHGGSKFPAAERTAVTNLTLPPPNDPTYTVGSTPNVNGAVVEWRDVTPHATTGTSGTSVRYSLNQQANYGQTTSDFSSFFAPGEALQGTIYAFSCESGGFPSSRSCSPGAAMTATGAPVLPRVEFPFASGVESDQCEAQSVSPMIFPGQAADHAFVQITPNTEGSTITVEVSFSGWNLDPVTWICQSPPPPPGEPEEPEESDPEGPGDPDPSDPEPGDLGSGDPDPGE